VDFFEDQLVLKRYDWKALLEEYMFEGKNPLVNSLVSGRMSPLFYSRIEVIPFHFKVLY
jgi:hypothetical protein